MMPYEYKHTDTDGDLLSISDDGGSALVTVSGTAVRIAPDKVRAAAEALYLACGLPSPVILDRQAVPEGEEWKPDGNSLLLVSRDRDRLTVRTTMDGGAAVLSPADARAMAGVLAFLADEAEAEPDPAEVKQLTEFLRSAVARTGTEGDFAYSALLWMKIREARDA